MEIAGKGVVGLCLARIGLHRDLFDGDVVRSVRERVVFKGLEERTFDVVMNVTCWMLKVYGSAICLVRM